MSKLLTTRYEYVVIDDAALSAAMPSYPSPLDRYVLNTVASAGSAYGVQNISGTAAQAVTAPAGATLLVYSPASNTGLISLQSTAATQLVAGGPAPYPVQWALAPGQFATLPGAFYPKTTRYNLIAVSSSLAILTTTPFTAQVFWSL